MKKIPSLFQRNYDGDRLVRDEVVPGAEWVMAGEGTATRQVRRHLLPRPRRPPLQAVRPQAGPHRPGGFRGRRGGPDHREGVRLGAGR